jgi:hypothetical protein
VSGVVLVGAGDPADWLLPYSDPCPCEREHRSTVRIDGDLPTVTEKRHLELRPYGQGNWRTVHQRPLRVGDKVTLATVWKDSDDEWCQSSFATATVARVEPRQDYMESSDRLVWLVTVSDVEALS